MDLSRQLKNANTTGKLLFGQRQTIDACTRGEAKLIILAAESVPLEVSAKPTDS